ncbi:hypothetical protein AW168_15605 [Nocardia brasiliensis]|uniref:Uncharacterized protein n=2 Tax=Nocardia TaxID=1817 RepID=K0F2U9_NOCB7|nr:hypothetical protein O3I_027605 [Nocardia brasiliensis ATCC 700358]KIA64534.1 hypothetical protein FG87_13345 [Nocardia vulneris]OCF89762.1 hypothetical protein AW168_15605 [Nocardia brasiliensis]
MTDALRLHGTAPKSDRVPPLHGLLVAESERDISVRVAEGTWTFRRSDVLRVLDSAVPEGVRAERGARPVLVDIRVGATADFTRRLRIDVVDRPMTMQQAPSAALGDEQLRELTESWADRLNLVDLPGTNGATFTYCQTKSLATSDDGINCDSLD